MGMVVNKTDLVQTPNLSCIGRINDSLISSFRDALQNLFLYKQGITDFIIILNSEGGTAHLAEDFINHLTVCQNAGVNITIWITERAFSEAAVIALLAKYNNLKVIAEERTRFIMHEPKLDYPSASLSRLQNNINEAWER